MLNPENSLNSPSQLTVTLPESVVGQTVRVVRTPAPDLSGNNIGSGTAEANVISLGEVEVMACQP